MAVKKVKNWNGFNDFVGREMIDLWNAMPDCFERTVMESGRQVYTHIYTGDKLEVLHDGWGIITKIRKVA